MPTLNEMFPTLWFKAEDLRSPTGKGFVEKTLTIAGLKLEEVGGNEDQNRPPDKKWAVQFKDETKSLILNKTNAQTIADALGDDSDDWLGSQIILFVMTVNSPNGPQPGIRVRVPAPSV